MSSTEIKIEGAKELSRQLRAMGGPKLRSVARSVVGRFMTPVLAHARAGAPVDGGRLRASLGKVVGANRRGDAFSARVGTRRDFAYKNTSGEKMVSGRGKVRDRAIARGFAQDRKTAQQYARPIETGVDSQGRNKRKAGGAHFLEDAILANESTITDNVAAELRRHIESTT